MINRNKQISVVGIYFQAVHCLDYHHGHTRNRFLNDIYIYIYIYIYMLLKISTKLSVMLPQILITVESITFINGGNINIYDNFMYSWYLYNSSNSFLVNYWFHLFIYWVGMISRYHFVCGCWSQSCCIRKQDRSLIEHDHNSWIVIWKRHMWTPSHYY